MANTLRLIATLLLILSSTVMHAADNAPAADTDAPMTTYWRRLREGWFWYQDQIGRAHV